MVLRPVRRTASRRSASRGGVGFSVAESPPSSSRSDAVSGRGARSGSADRRYHSVMELTPRKREILRRVVEEYVATGQPVGSRALVERAELSVSPSTVRNELAELETLGLLTHPAYLGGSRADRRRLPGVRRRARRQHRRQTQRVPAGSDGDADGARGVRSRRRRRCFRRRPACSPWCRRRPSRPRPSGTSRCCSSNRAS